MVPSAGGAQDIHIDDAAQIHDLDTGASAGRPFKGHDHNVFAAAVTGDGDDTVRIWRLS